MFSGCKYGLQCLLQVLQDVCVFSIFVCFWMNSRVLMKMTKWEDLELIPLIRLLLSSNVLNSCNPVAVFENPNTSASVWLSYRLDCASLMKKFHKYYTWSCKRWLRNSCLLSELTFYLCVFVEKNYFLHFIYTDLKVYSVGSPCS